MAHSSVFHRTLHKPWVAHAGFKSAIYSPDAPWRHDDQIGKYCIDLSSGAGVTCLGHSCQEVKDAMVNQIQHLPYAHSANWTTDACETLATELLKEIDEPHGGVFFLNSGAEAVEAACKLAVQCFAEAGNRARPVFHARKQSYHGNTLFTLALGDHPRKQQYAHALPAFSIRHFPTGDEGLKVLQHQLEAVVPINPRIVVVETVGGMTVGIAPPTLGYLVALRVLCDKYGAMLIYDEVLSGNYRSGKLFAWQYYQQHTKHNSKPDIMVLGKGLTAGYFPLSAVITTQGVMQTIKNGSKQLWHSTTNQNHPIGCAAGVKALQVYQSMVRAHAIEQLSLWLDEEAQKLRVNNGVEVTGIGALRGIRVKASDDKMHERIRNSALKAGVAIYTGGGTEYHSILLAPPYCITREQLAEAVQVLSGVIAANS